MGSLIITSDNDVKPIREFQLHIPASYDNGFNVSNDQNSLIHCCLVDHENGGRRMFLESLMSTKKTAQYVKCL